MPERCPWCLGDPLYIAYHDEEWGVPLHDDRALFELLVLEGAQAGLSWFTVLKKREHYRRVFDGFDAKKIARWTPAKIEKLLADPGIIRNRAKVEGTVASAKALLEIKKRHGSFDEFLWQFVGGKPRVNTFKALSEIPAETAESQAMSKALKKAGFTFCGPTICYAFMQAAGLVNDHLTTCFRYDAAAGTRRK
ncbi:MAG: DNA-3-methyladenine glycosylase I [Bryobacteraceae bacterium]